MTTAELATRILSQLGFSTAVTMEPSADYRRDKIVEMIDEQKAQWRREVLLTASAELNRSVEWDQVEHRWLADWERVRRMAEQSESN